MKTEERIKSEKEFYEKFYSENAVDFNKDYRLIEKVAFGINQLGKSNGKSVLDLCCGVGITSYHLAQEGWMVICLDISHNGIRLARQLAQRKGVVERMLFVVASAEDMPFRDDVIDAVFCNGGLHHTTLIFSVREANRVLKQGGSGVFIETSALNPLLMFARKYLAGRFSIPKKRTLTESPLRRKELKLIRTQFNQMQITKSFHFLSQAGGYLYKSGGIMDSILNFTDRILLSLPLLKKMGYWIVIKVVK